MAETDKDTLDKIKDREGEFSELWSRMDRDKSLYRLEAYKMKDVNNMEIAETENITRNSPYVFAQRVMSVMLGALMPIRVEGVKNGKPMTDTETKNIEDFCERILELGDEGIANMDLVGLHPFIVEHINIRGRIGARLIITRDGDGINVDLFPNDMRYLVYDTSPKGLKWVAPRINKKKQTILNEYEYSKAFNSIQSALEGKREALVTDYWDDKLNKIYVEGILAHEQENPFGYPPFVLQQSTTGSNLMDAESFKYTGESIYAANRDIYPEMNKELTVYNTLNLMSFMGGLQYKSSKGSSAKQPKMPPYGKRFIAMVEKDGGYYPMPVNDIKNSSKMLHAILESDAQRGSLPYIDYGNLTFPLSAVAISKLTSSRDQVYVPRFQALSLFYRALMRMMIDQFKRLNMTVELGRPGNKRKYTPAMLEGDYDITYKFISNSPEQTIADYSIAQIAALFLDEHTVLADILKHPNPDEVLQKRYADNAAKLSPLVLRHRTIEALIDQGREREAKLMLLEMKGAVGRVKEGKLLGDISEKGAPSPPNVGGTVPLMSQGQNVGRPTRTSSKEAAELGVEAEDRQVEGEE